MTPPTNHLQGQTSPYLLQHVHNPVDWYPWGETALGRARGLDRPIFLSIGYSACHWCHVMERESFENGTIAAYLNEHFVPIKVDREERPDIDEIYMTAVQLLTRHGGWPLSVFLTPDLEPFFGGTYFPPDSTGGRIGFLDILYRIREVWETRRQEVTNSSRELTARLRQIADGVVADPDGDAVGAIHRRRAIEDLAERFDPHGGGFGSAPKFPPDQALALLLREDADTAAPGPLEVVTTTLDRMALGGMYDHVGGGFSRYSVDDRWLVPHFEKMLYNQALLVPVYADAWVVTGRPLYRRVVEDTLDFVRRELTAPGGGLYSALDADSEGVEGKFYVWTPAQVRDVLGESDGARFCEAYDITTAGNFEGASIPNLLRGDLDEATHAEFEPLRAALREARESRVRPGTDDKILTAWNGLMITALCRGYQVFGRDADLQSATRAADFVLERMWDGRRLLATCHGDDDGRLDAYLDDHAFLARGLLDLYESSFDDAHLECATALCRAIVSRFEDTERGGYHFVADDHEALLTRTRSDHDGALPAGAGVATETLVRLAAHLDDEPFRASARRSLASYRAAVDRAPSAYASLLVASAIAEGTEPEVAIVGPSDAGEFRAMLRVAHGRYPPVLALASGQDASERPLLRGRASASATPAGYVCRDRICERPVVTAAELARSLDRRSVPEQSRDR